MSQEALAQLLSCSLPQIKMAESQSRPLPEKCRTMAEWILQMAEQLAQLPEVDSTFPKPDKELEILKLKKKKRGLENSLKKRKLKRKQMQSLVVFCEAFANMYPASQFPSAAMRLDALQFNAQVFMEDPNHWDDAQIKSQLEITIHAIKVLEEI